MCAVDSYLKKNFFSKCFCFWRRLYLMSMIRKYFLFQTKSMCTQNTQKKNLNFRKFSDFCYFSDFQIFFLCLLGAHTIFEATWSIPSNSSRTLEQNPHLYRFQTIDRKNIGGGTNVTKTRKIFLSRRPSGGAKKIY